ncbi:MAG: hypothetical protein A2V93_04585 [Ignavibacteria bacterium RBG_16_34_14]|nr:MAG: hypothetical protein A2V93_04585 [Ignavibacteria bacterium RBG_16_34_14]
MNEEQQSIWDYLNENAIGYENRKSSSEIRDNCDLEAGDTTNVYVGNLITRMILNHGCCIGSLMWNSGYWIIQDEVELDRVCESLENRANSIVERSNALRENWQQNNGKRMDPQFCNEPLPTQFQKECWINLRINQKMLS